MTSIDTLVNEKIERQCELVYKLLASHEQSVEHGMSEQKYIESVKDLPALLEFFKSDANKVILRRIFTQTLAEFPNLVSSSPSSSIDSSKEVMSPHTP